MDPHMNTNSTQNILLGAGDILRAPDLPAKTFFFFLIPEILVALCEVLTVLLMAIERMRG